MSSVPFTRTLPYVLREQLDRSGLRLVIGEVTAVPDAHHVTISQGGTATTIARISSYLPTVGDPAYCVAADTLVLALGAVGGFPVTPPTFVSGSGPPTAGVGTVGAIYFDTAAGRFWGPKTAGGWPASPIALYVPPAPVYGRTLFPSLTIAEPIAGEDERSWFDTFTRTKRFQWTVPTDRTGGSMFFTIGLRPFAAGTAVLRRSVFRMRVGATVLTIESGTNIDRAFGSTVTDAITTTISEANFQNGDGLRVDIQRLGGDAGDTINNHLGFDYANATYFGN